VETAEGQNAVIGLAFDPDERPSAPDVLVNIVVRVLALVANRLLTWLEGANRVLQPYLLEAAISRRLVSRCNKRGIDLITIYPSVGGSAN